MPEPDADFRTYLPLADKVANKWAARLRNWSLREDMRQVAATEIWWQHLRYDPAVEATTEAVLFKRAEGAVLLYLKKTVFNGPRTLSVGGWEDEYDFEFAESLKTPAEEIGGQPVRDPRLSEKVEQRIEALPLVQKAVMRGRFSEEKSVAEVAAELGLSAGAVLEAESTAMAEIRASLGLQPPPRHAPKPALPETEEVKVCAHCRDPKPLVEFGRQNGDEHGHSYCKPCAIHVSKEALYRRRAEARRRWKERADSKEKRCPFCRRDLPFTHFAADGRTTDGLALACDECQDDWLRRRAGRTLQGVKKPRYFFAVADKVVEETARMCRRGRLCLAFPRLEKPADAVPGGQARLCYDCQNARLAMKSRRQDEHE